ncbi:MAG: quinolinate synthase NadA [Thermoplasmatota archaeon]
MRHMRVLAELPDEYHDIDAAEREKRTGAARRTLGKDCLILAHNYQADEVYRWAHATGDSYQLSKLAKANHDAKHIVFAGVSFMAETADLLTLGERNVILPSMEASCPMAGMSEMVQVGRAWDALENVRAGGDAIIPVAYVNSYADLKAFVGENGGVVCTSANSKKAFTWALSRAEREAGSGTGKLLFLPDKHLGANTAHWLGIPPERVKTWNPWSRDGRGGLGDDELDAARVILWEGYCQVHDRFKVEHIREMREMDPGLKVVVHPECRRDVVDAADAAGSTSEIESWVAAQPAGTHIAIGTEIHMVQRLAATYRDKNIEQLCGKVCLDCNAMRQVDPRYLLWVLEELVDGRVANRIRVDDVDRPGALLALDRMLAL